MRTSLLTSSCLLALGLMAPAESAQAQFFGGLKDRLADAVARRVEKNVEDRVVGAIEDRAESMVDNSFEAMFNPAGTAGAQSSAGGSNIFSRLTDTSDIEVAERYDFDIAATFEVQTLDRRGRRNRDEDMEMVFYYSEDAPYTGTRMTEGPGAEQEGSAMIIYDFEHQLMLMLMESEGERFAMPYNWAAVMEDAEAWPTDEASTAAGDMPSFEHIGSRRISGFESEGYRVRNETHVTEIWVSDEVAPGIERVFQANRSMPMLGGSMPPGYPQGMLMELNSEDLESGESVVMRTTDIDMDAEVSFQMSDYPILDLGAMMRGNQ